MKIMMFNKEYGLQRAVLLGIKELTRRDGTKVFLLFETGLDVRRDSNGRRETLEEYAIRKSPYKVGDVVAVAQSYRELIEEGHFSSDTDGWVPVALCESGGYRNKMFVRADLMPHRIKITGVRFEQLKCISDEECLKEGIYRRNDVIDSQMHDVICYQYVGTPSVFKSPRDAFASLIDKLSGKGTWERNPWVYVYSFKLVQ